MYKFYTELEIIISLQLLKVFTPLRLSKNLLLNLETISG